MHPLLVLDSSPSTPIEFVHEGDFNALCARLTLAQATQIRSQGIAGKAGQVAQLYNALGVLDYVIFFVEGASASWRDPFLAGKLPALLPEGTYHFTGELVDVALSSLAFLSGQYVFNHYKASSVQPRKLKLDTRISPQAISAELDAIALARDLINTPANDLGPQELEDAVRLLAQKHKGEVTVITGDALLTANFPLIYHVGKASTRAPRLIEMTWGNPAHPLVAVVGKGVCFDTGGLNIKPDHGMLTMKKDMGGAATAIALALMIVRLNLPVRLQLLIPAVENAIAGNAFRPSDIYPSRQGLSVEIGNTDAEGRLVLADALTYAQEGNPALILDFATLTGAARVALGPDLPPFYTHDEGLALSLHASSLKKHDPLWRMPLWMPYFASMDAKIADVSSTGSLPFAGSITAAHFLSRFVGTDTPHVHFDIFAWVPVEKPGRTLGGELQAARACFDMIASRFPHP